MFSPDALEAILAGTLFDMELSSDDEEPFRFTSERELQSVRVGADVINQNQREVFPPDSDEDEGPSSSWIGTNDPGVADTCDEVVLEVPPTTEIESSHENILQNITPKQNISWRHRELLNTISSDWFPPISIDPTVEAPVDYYFRSSQMETYKTFLPKRLVMEILFLHPNYYRTIYVQMPSRQQESNLLSSKSWSRFVLIA